MKFTNFSLTLNYIKNCTVKCTTEIHRCTMSYILFDFIFTQNNIHMIIVRVTETFYYLNSFSSSFIDVLELNLTTEKIQRRPRLIHGQ